MTPEEIVRRCPRLYHVTEPGAHESVRRHGLLSTVALLDLFETPESDRLRLLRARRPEPVPLSHPVHGEAILNDQRPLSMKALETCLDDGMAPADWLGMLNGKVFFWPDEKQLQRLTQARANRARQRAPARRKPRGTGAFAPIPSPGRSTVSRDMLFAPRLDLVAKALRQNGSVWSESALATFALAKDHAWEEWRSQLGGRDSVVEVAIDHRVASAGDALVEVRCVGKA